MSPVRRGCGGSEGSLVDGERTLLPKGETPGRTPMRSTAFSAMPARMRVVAVVLRRQFSSNLRRRNVR